MEISSTHGQRQSSWLRLCRLPEDGGNARADGKTCEDRFLQPGQEVASGKFALQTLLLSVDIIKKFGEISQVGDPEW